MRLFYLLFAIAFVSCSSTNTYVSPSLTSKGKKIGIGSFKIALQKKGNKYGSDSVCNCIAESIETALTPYLNTSGFNVFNPGPGKIYSTSLIKTASTPDVEVDYVIKGTGLVDKVGSSYFVNQLSIELQDVKNGEVLISASFTGVSIRPIKAAQKIGKSLMKKIK